MNLFDLQATLGLNDTEYSKGIEKAKGSAKSFSEGAGKAIKGAAVAFAAVTAAVGAMTAKLAKATKATAEYGDTVDEDSQKLGMSAEAYQKWSYVLGVSGSSMDGLQMGMKSLTNTIDEANQGNDTAIAKFSRLGISMDEIKGKSTEEVFMTSVKALQNVTDQTEKAAMANDLFSRAGQSLLPVLNSSNGDLDAMLKTAQDYGMVMSDEAVKASGAFNDSLTTLQMTATGLKNRLIGEFMPSLTLVSNGLALLFTGDTSGLDGINQGISETVNKATEMLPKILRVGSSIISSLATSIISNLPVIFNSGIEMINTIISSLIINAPLLISSGMQIILAIITGITSMLTSLDATAPNILSEIVNAINMNLGQIISASFSLVVALAQGIISSLPQLIPSLLETINQIVLYLTDPNSLTQLINVAIQLIFTLANGLLNAIPELVGVIPTIIENVVMTLLQLLPQLIPVAINMITTIAVALTNAIPELLTALPEIIVAIIGAFKNVDWGSIGRNIMQGLIDGLKSMLSNVAKAGEEVANTIKNKFKDILGIHSPSVVFKEFGQFIDKGLAIGISDNTDIVGNSIDDLSNTTTAFSAPAINASAPETRKITLDFNIEDDGTGLARYLFKYLRIAEREITV